MVRAQGGVGPEPGGRLGLGAGQQQRCQMEPPHCCARARRGVRQQPRHGRLCAGAPGQAAGGESFLLLHTAGHACNTSATGSSLLWLTIASLYRRTCAAPIAQAAQLRVRKPNDAGRPGTHYTSMVDTAVYSRWRQKHQLDMCGAPTTDADQSVMRRNRHFRVMWSCKGGKDCVLVPTPRFAAADGDHAICCCFCKASWQRSRSSVTGSGFNYLKQHGA